MKKMLSIFLCLAVTACSTPTTTLKNPKTGQVVTCGGDVTGALVGGAIGYHVQKGNDVDCINAYQLQGFKTVEYSK